MVSKPCARVGCRNLVTVRQPYKLKRKKYCSTACQVAAKKAAGWTPHRHLTAEVRRRGGIASAKRTIEIQRRRALKRAVHETVDLIPRAFELELSARLLAWMKVNLGQAFERGRRWEHKRLEDRRRRDAQKETAA